MAKASVEPDTDVAEAVEAYERAREAFQDNYSEALDDFQFARLGKQWPVRIERDRQLDGRPCLTINRLPAFIRQVVNDARQNKPSINVHPVDSTADVATAEVIDGLIRHIEQSSDADVAYDTALEHAVTGGFGWFGINTKYATDDSFEQDLVIEAKPNAFAIVGDPSSTASDSSDWNSAFELTAYTPDAFEDKFGDAEKVSFDDAKGVGKTPERDEDNITVAMWWTREKSERQIVAVSAPDLDAPDDAVMAAIPLLAENLIIDLKVYKANKDLFDAIGVKIQGSPRTVPSFKVRQRLMSGSDVLEENDWAGKFIPIIPVYGEDLNIEGKRHLRSMVRDAKDPQKMFNYWRTCSTELVALAPKAPFIGPVGAFVTDAAKWASANTQNHAYIEFDTRDATGQPISMMPQRQPFAGVPAGAIQEALNASDDMKSIMGLFDASLGARSNETSGVAIMGRQREGDVSTFHFIDNMARSIRHAGRVILDLIPSVYTTPRIVRVLGKDGLAKAARCAPGGSWPTPIVANSPQPQMPGAPGQLQPQPMPGQPQIGQPGAPPAPQPQRQGAQQELQVLEGVFDLTAGKYDLTVTAGPSYTTQREEAANQMIELIRAYPQAAPLIGDLVAKNLDWPGAQEIGDRFKAMLPAQLQGDNPQLDAAKAQISEMAQILGKIKAENEALKADRSIDQSKADTQQFDAETKRLGVLVGKNGAPVDPSEIMPAVMVSMMHILQQPDLIEAANNGADPQAVMAAMMSRLQGQGGPPQVGGQPQPQPPMPPPLAA